ncbi:MAG: 5'/3'-nucleotidase SurE [Polyangiaceae bacterium]|nr:5'/3'-nucleotidase SurE [Polyangiaceae bacterium]
MPDVPIILLSNDDGHAAEGLRLLRGELQRGARVIVCAPEVNQSATSHSLSLHRVLRLRHVEQDVFALDGTPADCVYVALNSGNRVLPRLPDLVVSGMNHGLNLSHDVFYSGTVAAAREAALRGIPSIAVSADAGADRPSAAALAARLALELLENHRRNPSRTAPLFNVNIPPGNAWPVRPTKIGKRLYTQDVVYRHDPRGHEYLWIGGGAVRHDHAPGSDTEAYDEGCVSVTPITLDLVSSEHDELCAATCAAVPAPKVSD